MAKPEWGLKRTCQSCGVRFYDLRRDPIVCPACQTVFDPDRVPRPRRLGPAIKDEPVAASFGDDETTESTFEEDGAESSGRDADLADADEDADDGGSEIEELASEDGELMEDTSELGEDDDDIGEVMEHIDDEADEKP